MKSIFQFVFKRNILLSLHYVPSKENPANSPLCTLSDLDCSLSKDAWKCVETTFGPHSIDLMALPENVWHDRSGRPLRFFFRFPCFQTLGTNVFSQHIQVNEKSLCLPALCACRPPYQALIQRRMSLYNCSPGFDPQEVLVATALTNSVRVIHVRFLWLHKHLTIPS